MSILRGAVFLLLCCQSLAAAEEILRTISQVRGLSPEKIAEKPRFELTASVTYAVNWEGRCEVAVQDETAGIYTYMAPEDVAKLSFGDEMELKGTVRAGSGPPCLEVEECLRTGEKNLPLAVEADFTALDNASLDSQFVELEGIVRDVQYDPTVSPPSTIVTVQMKGGRAEVFLALNKESGLEALVDSLVRVRAVPFHYFNQSRQPFGFRLMARGADQIEVLKSSPQPPFEMPVTGLEHLLRYQPAAQSGHRVRVRGTVTLYRPGEFLYMQDGGEGILVRSRRREPLEPGDQIEVAAFATMNGYSAILEDAEFRKLGKGEPPRAVDLGLEELVVGRHDARLVSTEGVLVGVSERNGMAQLMIRQGTLIMPVDIPVPLKEVPAISPGSLLRVTGICQIELGSRRKFASVYRPEAARLILRSTADLVVLRSAPWWTAGRLRTALLASAAVIGVASSLLWYLQRKNSRLRREISARLLAEEEVRRREEERKTLAADLHDSLEQSLTGVALQLQAAGGEDTHLKIARRLLEHSREEVHRAVRDLREPSDVDLDLRQALQDLVKRVSTGSTVDFTLSLPEEMPGMGRNLSHQVLHLVQEGVTNALKHGAPSSVGINLRQVGEMVELRIADDGIGSDEFSRPGPAEGHFGLQGMKERAARAGGSFRIDSNQGGGTRIEVMLPLK